MKETDIRYVQDAAIEDGKIYEKKFDKSIQQIGVTLDVFDELEASYNALATEFNKYQDKLIELGKRDNEEYIKIPLSPEDQVRELLKINEAQAAQIQAQATQINTIAGHIDKLMARLGKEDQQRAAAAAPASTPIPLHASEGEGGPFFNRKKQRKNKRGNKPF